MRSGHAFPIRLKPNGQSRDSLSLVSQYELLPSLYLSSSFSWYVQSALHSTSTGVCIVSARRFNFFQKLELRNIHQATLDERGISEDATEQMMRKTASDSDGIELIKTYT